MSNLKNLDNKKSTLNDLKSISNFDLLTRMGILKNVIEEFVDDPRVIEPKRQLIIIEAEIERRGLKKSGKNGEYNIPKEEVFNTKSNNNQTIRLDTIELAAKKD